MPELIVPQQKPRELILKRPDNVRGGKFGSYVTHDMFDIAHRLREVSPHLNIQVLDPPVKFMEHEWNFAIVEQCADGVERLVYRTEALDARIIEHVQYLRAVPFEKRFAEAEKLEDKLKEEEKQRKLDELYEHMGGNMLIQLERCGFIDRPVSHAKRNPTARRHRNAGVR